jgi:hypothetical protein
MSKFGEYANSATDKITQSPYSLRSITTTLSEVPVTLTFGQLPCGADRVSVKNRSENSDCSMLCSVPELADLPNVVMDLVFNEVKKRTGGDAQYDLGYISTKNLVSVWRGR